MQTRFIIAAALAAVAMPGAAAPTGELYALSAEHADLQDQLEVAAGIPGEVGGAARLAADLMELHSQAQEEIVLPWLGYANRAASGRALEDAGLLEQAQDLEVILARLNESDVELVSAVVDLYSAAEDAGRPEILRLAERIIWHETSDVEILYPATLLVSRTRTSR